MSQRDDRQRAIEQHVWAIIRASGGWNARSRARLAHFAIAKRVETWRLAQAVRAVSSAAYGERKGDEFGAPLAGSGAVHAAAVAGAAIPSAAGARSAVAANGGGDPAVAAPRSSGLVTAIVFLGAGALLSAALMWAAVRYVQEASRTPPEQPLALVPVPDAPPPPDAGKDRSPKPLGRRTGEGITRPAPAGRSVPPATAIYPRPPALMGDLTTAWLREALETLSAHESAVERAAVGTSPMTDAEAAEFRRVLDAFLESWPVLEAPRRGAVLDAILSSVQRLDSTHAQSLRERLAQLRTTSADTPRDWWQGSGAAALLDAMQGAGPTGLRNAFATGALQWLGPKGAVVAQAAPRASKSEVSDLCESWLAALDGAAQLATDASCRAQRDGALIGAIEALMRTGAPLGQPGTPADAMGTLLDALPWAGTADRREHVVQAWRTWLGDETIAPAALHGATSVLSAQRPGAWWDPWMVVDARASAADRAGVAERFANALATEPAVADLPHEPLRGVDPELVRTWRHVYDELAARAAPTTDPGRVARAAEWMALVEAARCMERGRVSDADARLAQLRNPAGLQPDETDRWRDRKALTEVRVPTVDGKLEAELRNRRSLEDRLNVLRALRTRPVHDLGPLDAETLAREACSAPSEQIRSVAQGVIVDTYDRGPQVIGAVLGEVNTAASAQELAQLAGALCSVPTPRGPDAALRASAALLLADRLASVLPSERNMLDAAAKELALGAAACARLLGAETAPGVQPQDAMHTWARARATEAQRTVPASVLIPLLTHANARARGAQGAAQQFAAEQTLLLELDGAMLSERVPRRRAEIQALLQRAGAARAQAPDVIAQIDANARTLAELAALAIGAETAETQQ